MLILLKKKRYKKKIGLIIFFIVETRPNIIFAISLVSHFVKNSSYQHIKAVKTILKYFKKAKY